MTGAPLWFVGVDGGATRCRARVRDASGAKLAEAAGAAANVHVDFAAAVAVIRALVVEALGRAGAPTADPSRTALGLGLAGVNDARDADRAAAAFPGYARALAANDAVTACIGAHAGAEGGLVIAGTGSAAIARGGGRETIVGGRGFTLGDDGSGAHVGLDALRAATRAGDGLGPESALTRDILRGFDGDVVALVRWARAASPGDFGAFAPLVFERAGEGDEVARRIVAKAARAIEQLVRRVAALGAERVALVGGVGDAVRRHLAPGTAAVLTRPLHDATDGAILMVGGKVATGRNEATCGEQVE
ncbi:glucosamine kinase [Roseiarcus fermentans]|uniref:Glucosamine kinase n=1 Tax=Roseiarcus fermentans TaxID=1473586 RepID=A0A366FGS1_9HYPH|nr:BadF/BadG/BcrA/BcrD ATPase family protein [Roseiarcus fermentans]RBP13858.1 glucosamine kinase [Roseiarcus fermentans]